MGESGTGKLNYEKDILKETLCTQQQLLHKLYNELEAEREASSSAASEAMSVILRLQGEKAAVQMEAEQYKRLAEEKMCYAEESLSIFEDIMYQKEMEVSSLEAQVQAYRDKLRTSGFDDPETSSRRTENGEMTQMSLMALARRNSAPPISLKSRSKKSMNDEESCSSSTRTKTAENCTNELSSESSNIEGIVSYMEQMRKLDRRVKEIAGVSYLRTRSPSPVSQKSGASCDPSLLHLKLKAIVHPKDNGNVNENSVETEEMANETSSSPGVLDVFEVPQVDQRYDDTQLRTRNERKRAAPDEEEEEFHKMDVSEEAVKPSNHGENYWLNRVMTSSNKEKEVCVPSNDAIEVDCNLAMLATKSIPSVSLHKFQQHLSSQASGIVESQELAIRQDGTGREEELKLLREIKDQITSIQSEINSWKPKETAPPTPKYEPSVDLLREAMIYFWM